MTHLFPLPSLSGDSRSGGQAGGPRGHSGLGLRAPVALGTAMAMAQRPRPGWASYHYYPAYHQHNNNCQDVGNSILLLLGLIICINIGINMVTLVRARPSGMTDNAGGGGRMAGTWGAIFPGRRGSLCSPLPSSGADSESSYPESSVPSVRKVSRKRGQEADLAVAKAGLFPFWLPSDPRPAAGWLPSLNSASPPTL